MKRLFYAFFVLFMASFQLSDAQSVKGLYVNKFNEILGNSTKEDSLLRYAKGNSYNYLALYSLNSVDFAAKAASLASFISRARNDYGMKEIGAVGESISFFQEKVVPYNNSRNNAAEKFNVFNLEFEFWIPSSVSPGGMYANTLSAGGYSLDTAGGFKYYKKIYSTLKDMASQQGALTETYVGWLNAGQARFIAGKSNRILVHLYRDDVNSTFNYSKTRLEHFASANRSVVILPIFSSEPEFMGPWVKSNAETDAFKIFMNNYNADNSGWKKYIVIGGYQWFKYSLMPATNLFVGDPTATEELSEEKKALAEASIKATFKVYPNPSEGIVNINMDTKDAKDLSIHIININGQLVKQKNYDNQSGGQFNEAVDLSTLAKGVYFVQVQANEEVIKNEKIILN